MLKLVLIACGGGLGAVARDGLAGVAQRLGDGGFPLGTLVVNLTGCLLIGVVAGFFSGPSVMREEVRLAITVGFLGGFTTFSTFGLETFVLLTERGAWPALSNMLLSNLVGLTLVWAGYRLANSVSAAWT